MAEDFSPLLAIFMAVDEALAEWARAVTVPLYLLTAINTATVQISES